MVTLKIVLSCLSAALCFAPLAAATPTQQDMELVQSIFDSSARDDLAVLKVCGKPELQSQYLQSLLEAGIAYPRRDPKKIRALVREIQRHADLLAEIRTGFIQRYPPKPEDFRSECQFNVQQAVKHLQWLDDFIFKS